MTVKELRFMLENKKDDVNVVFMSTSGMEWEVRDKTYDSIKDDDKVVIYIK